MIIVPRHEQTIPACEPYGTPYLVGTIYYGNPTGSHIRITSPKMEPIEDEV